MIQSTAVILFVIPYLIQCSTVLSNAESCNCGRKLQPRVVGGNETEINEYPFMAGIVDAVNKELYCGATIISNQHLLTAVHCIEDRDITKIGIIVGEHDVTTGKETNATKLYRILRVLMHPEYDDTSNDIAIVSIVGKISYSTEVGPVCLPVTYEFFNFTGQPVTLLGWGLLAFGGTKSTTLQKVEVDVISTATCKQSFPTVDNTALCTYTSGKDSCQMDTGGPVLWTNPNTSAQILVGIISSGIGCTSNEPAINVRVDKYISWIVEHTGGIGLCGA